MKSRKVYKYSLLLTCMLSLFATVNIFAAEDSEDGLWVASSPFLKAEQTQKHLEPAIVRPDWEENADEKLGKKLRMKGKPNFLIIYVDDMGWGDPGVYGGGPALGAPTPNIDALAASGLRMTSGYSQPACTPTRAAWQTGRLPQRSGLTRPTAAGEASTGMAGEVTIAELLRKSGYRTGMAGKWHLGEAEGMWPTDVGYEEYYGNLGVNTAYHDWRDEHFSPELVNDPERYAMAERVDFIKDVVRSSANARGKTKVDEVQLGPEIDLETEPHLEKMYLDWSKDFMRTSIERKKPFFLYHAMNRVHTKNHPNPKFKGKSPASTPFRDGIMEVDFVVGQLINFLDRHGIRDNTFVIFTSDNGAEDDVHAGGINTSDAGHQPWRGAKGTTWEGGVRVSTLASWPSMIADGRISDGLFDHMDIFNTVARMAGVSANIPDDRYIDGIDQTSWLLLNKGQRDEQESNREAIFYWYGQDFYGVRWAEFKRMERIMNIGMSVGPQTQGGLFNATKSDTSDPSLGWYFNLYSDPKERFPITRTWNIATLGELATRNKMTFVNYPSAPRGVYLNGYLIGGPVGEHFNDRKKEMKKKIIQHLISSTITPSAMPD